MSSVTIQIPYRQYPYPTEHKVEKFLLYTQQPKTAAHVSCNEAFTTKNYRTLFLNTPPQLQSLTKHMNKKSVREPAKGVVDRNLVEERFPADNTYRYFRTTPPPSRHKGSNKTAKIPFSVRSTPGRSACPLHIISGCGEERRILIGPW